MLGPTLSLMPDPIVLAPEDAKLVTLARATRARTSARQGAAVRDLDGRTYAAATVELTHLHVSAVGGCVAMAVASGARGLEAVVLLGEGEPDASNLDASDLAVVSEFAGPGVPIFTGDARGSITARTESA